MTIPDTVRLRRDLCRIRQIESWRDRYGLTDSETRELIGLRRRVKWLMGSAQEAERRTA